MAGRLRSAGHDVVAVDLPCEDEVGLTAYADAAVAAIDDHDHDVVLVAQSLAGFIAPLVAAAVPVELMVLVAAMVPKPGETGHQWWIDLDHQSALAAQNLPDESPETLFVHDVPAEILASVAPPRDQTATLFDEPWPLPSWPAVATRFLACADDRFFPTAWLGPIVEERLGITADVIPGGHCAFLSQPGPLADAILDCWDEHIADFAAD